MFRRVKRSDRETKHLKAPSATYRAVERYVVNMLV